MSASFVPDHKASMVLFLDRVYGIENQDFLLHVLEVGFLPDMRAAASLDTVSRKRHRQQVKQQEQFHFCQLQKSLCWCDLMSTCRKVLHWLQIVFLSPSLIIGGLQYDWNGPGTEPLPLFGCSASAHQVCPVICWDGPPGHHDRLHAAHHLSFVPWPSSYQGSEGRHWGVPHVALQVSTNPSLYLGKW